MNPVLQALIKTGNFIIDNWSNIVCLFAICVAILMRIEKFFSMSKEEQKKAILKVVKEELIKLMSDAEKEWNDYIKSGDIKKSQVINIIYKQFPALSTFANQEDIIKEITKMIEDVKPTMDKIFENTEQKK